MERQLIKQEVEYEFIEAVAAQELNPRVTEEIVSEQLISPRPLKLTEIACLLSHKTAIEKALAQNLKEFVILEDDLILSPYFKKTLDDMETKKINSDLVLLYNHPIFPAEYKLKEKVNDLVSLYEIKESNVIIGAVGYYLKARAGRQLVGNLVPIKDVYDAWVNYKKENLINEVSVLFPFIFNHAEYYSEIQNEHKHLRLKSIHKYLLNKFKPFPLWQLIMQERRRKVEMERKRKIIIDGKNPTRTYL